MGRIIQIVASISFLLVCFKAGAYYGQSAYAYCNNNPVNFVDPNGCDTLNITYKDEKWVFDAPIIAEGNDVFNVIVDGKTSSYTFSDSSWGERVNALNLEITDDYSLGIYHISGAETHGTGYYVTPGGEPSLQENSYVRLPEDTYPIISPTEKSKWQQPGVGGKAIDRGCRFHYGGTTPREWTVGCFVLAFNYEKQNDIIKYDKLDSQSASEYFDLHLGGSAFFPYTTKDGKHRFGSSFKQGINKILILQSR